MKAQGSVAIVAIVVVLVVLIGIGIYFVNNPPQGYAFFERTTVIDKSPDVIKETVIYNNTETRTIVEDDDDSVTIINNPSSTSTSTSTQTNNSGTA